MTAFILTWNPTRVPIPDDVYAARVAQTVRGEPEVGPWSTGRNRRRISPGDVLYWLRQGPDRRGLMGSGVARTPVFQDQHYADPSRQANYVVHAWEFLLPVEDRLPTEVLLSVVPGVVWNHLQGSGYRVPSASEDLLAATWRSHLDEIGRRLPPTATDDVSPRTVRARRRTC